MNLKIIKTYKSIASQYDREVYLLHECEPSRATLQYLLSSATDIEEIAFLELLLTEDLLEVISESLPI